MSDGETHTDVEAGCAANCTTKQSTLDTDGQQAEATSLTDLHITCSPAELIFEAHEPQSIQ